MKKLTLILIAFITIFTSCEKVVYDYKHDKIEANSMSFKANDGDIGILKAAPASPITYDRTWSLYAKNSPFYSPSVFSLVNGRELITGTNAYNYWKTNVNPVTLPANQSLVLKYVPDESLRIIAESKLKGTPATPGNGKVAYLGMVDFQPSTSLTVPCYRLGDVLQINIDDLTKGKYKNLTYSIEYDITPIDLVATKEKPILIGGVFGWSDIVYKAPVHQTPVSVPINQVGDFTIYNDYNGKVSDVTIVITDKGKDNNGHDKDVTLRLHVSFTPMAGKGILLILTTDKVDWFDKDNIDNKDNDITVKTVYVSVDC